MSIKTIDRVWDGFPGSGSKLLAMLALADWSDETGFCFPSMKRIAEKTRLSRSQAQRVVHDLIDEGYIRVVGNQFGGKPGETRRYLIVLSSLTGRTVATGSVGATDSTDTQDEAHGCVETGCTYATQTVSEPSVNRQIERRSPKGSRISRDWSLPDEYRHWSINELGWPPIKCDHVAAVFRDYWIAQSGSKGVKSDWFATWRNWCRREKDHLQTKRQIQAKKFTDLTYEEGRL